jgi:hypothetical protein
MFPRNPLLVSVLYLSERLEMTSQLREIKEGQNTIKEIKNYE